MNPETLEDIVDPNVNGELWVAGPALVKVNLRTLDVILYFLFVFLFPTTFRNAIQ